MDGALNALALLVGISAFVVPWFVWGSAIRSRFPAVSAFPGLIAIATFLVMVVSACGAGHLARDIDPDYCETTDYRTTTERSYYADRCFDDNKGYGGSGWWPQTDKYGKVIQPPERD